MGDEDHGGYSVHTRFQERWVELRDPPGVSDTPSAADAARYHPYLSRERARGSTIRRVWVIRKHPSETSVAGGPYLGYTYEHARTGEAEIVLITDVERFTAWIAEQKH